MNENTQIEVVLREVRGAVIVIPKQSDFMLRVEVSGDDELPKPLANIPAKLTLKQHASSVEAADVDAQEQIYPEAGVPEQIIGVLIEQNEKQILVDACGVVILLDLAEDISQLNHQDLKLGTLTHCTLTGSLFAENITLLATD